MENNEHNNPATMSDAGAGNLFSFDANDVQLFSDPEQYPEQQDDAEAGNLFFGEPEQPQERQANTPPEITADEWDALFKSLQDAQEKARRAGMWTANPSKELIQRARVFFDQHVGPLQDALKRGGAADDVIDAVCMDYTTVLTGVLNFSYSATPLQMYSALRAITPYDAFTIDRYGLYFGLLWNYSRFLLMRNDYDKAVKSDDATNETKREFIGKFYSLMDSRAVRWLLNYGHFEPGDFAGFDPGELYAYFTRHNELADVGEYVLYYTVARTALVATPEDLAVVTPPPAEYFNPGEPLEDFAERVARDVIKNLNTDAAIFAGAITAATSTEREQARQAGKDWNGKATDRPVKIYENYGIVLSRPVEVAAKGKIKDIVPAQNYIDDFNNDPARFCNIPIRAKVTADTIQKVIEAIGLLPYYYPKPHAIDAQGRLSYFLNLSELSGICGYADANQEEKQALLASLLLIRHFYFVVDKPVKTDKIVNSKGKTVNRKTGGLVVLQFVNVPEIGLQTGNIQIDVYPESLKGHATLIPPDAYNKLRAEAKSLPQRRFNMQIATKSHKSERDLIDEVFGYADRLKYAAPEERAAVKREIQKHRSRDKNKILGWFEKYAQAGIVTDYHREPSKTDKRDFVLSWKCPDKSRLSPPPVDVDDEIAGEQ